MTAKGRNTSARYSFPYDADQGCCEFNCLDANPQGTIKETVFWQQAGFLRKRETDVTTPTFDDAESFECRPHVAAALGLIRADLERVMWNALQEEFPDPFQTEGNSFSCDVFAVKAYVWDEDQSWNFKWGDVEITWEKFFGRGCWANVDISPDLAATMLEACLAELHHVDDVRELGKATIAVEYKEGGYKLTAKHIEAAA